MLQFITGCFNRSVLFTLLFIFQVNLCSAEPQYTITDLGDGYGLGISPSGLVSGYGPEPDFYGFVRGISTNYNLGAADIACGINNNLQVAGYYNALNSSYQIPYIWNGTTPTLLGTFVTGDVRNNEADAINASGEITGSCALPDGSYHAVYWIGTTPVDLGTLGGADSIGYSINAQGEIAGDSDTPTGATHGVIWNGTAITDLGTLGGTNSDAFGINDLGQVVGRADLADGSTHAVVWNAGIPSDLGTLPGQTSSAAYSINSSGEIIGISGDPFLYVGGEMYDLYGLLGSNSGVSDIVLNAYSFLNDSGQIMLDATFDGRGGQVLLLTPAPEPINVTLIGGIALIAHSIGRTSRRLL